MFEDNLFHRYIFIVSAINHKAFVFAFPAMLYYLLDYNSNYIKSSVSDDDSPTSEDSWLKKGKFIH